MKLMRTTAVRDGDDWIINGAKTHVNLGCESQVTLVYAIAGEGITAFLVDTDLPGVSTSHTDPIGLRLIPTADVTFTDVRVPNSALLGEAGRGMDTFFSTFNMSRLGNASELIGFGRRALADAIAYGSGREVGDSVVTAFQGIQWTVADCYSDLYGASLARDHAANLHDAGTDVALATTLAKKMAIRASEHAVNEAFALTGGHGLYTDTDYGQLLHDMKVLRVAGGSLEVLRNYVARRVLRGRRLRGPRLSPQLHRGTGSEMHAIRARRCQLGARAPFREQLAAKCTPHRQDAASSGQGPLPGNNWQQNARHTGKTLPVRRPE